LFAPVETVTKRVPPSAGVLEAINDNSCLLHTGSHSLDSLAIHLIWLGVEFRVHEPPELLAHLCKLAERMQKAGTA
jgi:predicted DNA-binding transcriptional regulator YafY